MRPPDTDFSAAGALRILLAIAAFWALTWVLAQLSGPPPQPGEIERYEEEYVEGELENQIQ